MTELLVSAGVLAAFLAARRFSRLARQHPLANPTLVAALLVGLALLLTGTSVARFEEAAWPLRWVLGPAIVALAHFIASHAGEMRRHGPALLGATAGGSLAGILSAVLCAHLFGFGPALSHALSTKSVTSPFAIAIMERLGGPVALGGGLAVTTGMLGAIILPPVLKALRLDDSVTFGVAVGQAAHIAGTDALTRRDARAAAYAGLTTALAGLITALLLPLLWPWLF